MEKNSTYIRESWKLDVSYHDGDPILYFLHSPYFPLYSLGEDFFCGPAENHHGHHLPLFNPKAALQGSCPYRHLRGSEKLCNWPEVVT